MPGSRMVKREVWLRPAPVARFFFLLIYVAMVVLGALTMSSASQVGWWLPIVAIVPAVYVIQALGAGVRVDREQLVIRGMFVEHHIPRSRVVGLSFLTSLDVVVRGGLWYTTNLIQTNIRPSAERLVALGRQLSADGATALPVISEEDRRSMGGPGPDFAPELLHHERMRAYWPEGWQWLLYAVFVGACVFGSVAT